MKKTFIFLVSILTACKSQHSHAIGEIDTIKIRETVYDSGIKKWLEYAKQPDSLSQDTLPLLIEIPDSSSISLGKPYPDCKDVCDTFLSHAVAMDFSKGSVHSLLDNNTLFTDSTNRPPPDTGEAYYTLSSRPVSLGKPYPDWQDLCDSLLHYYNPHLNWRPGDTASSLSASLFIDFLDSTVAGFTPQWIQHDLRFLADNKSDTQHIILRGVEIATGLRNGEILYIDYRYYGEAIQFMEKIKISVK